MRMGDLIKARLLLASGVAGGVAALLAAAQLGDWSYRFIVLSGLILGITAVAKKSIFGAVVGFAAALIWGAYLIRALRGIGSEAWIYLDIAFAVLFFIAAFVSAKAKTATAASKPPEPRVVVLEKKILVPVEAPAKASAPSRAAPQKSALPVLHFTRSTNVISILQFGLLSRSELKKRNLGTNALDGSRYDSRILADGYICTSVGFPNSAMFFKKRSQVQDSFVVIELETEILKKLSFWAFPTNAASTSVRQAWDAGNRDLFRGLDALRQTFAEIDSANYGLDSFGFTRSEYGTPPNCPNDPQAEVLFQNAIDASWIKAIHFESGSALDQFAAKYKLSPSTLKKFKVSRNYFEPRSDQSHWKKGMRADVDAFVDRVRRSRSASD